MKSSDIGYGPVLRETVVRRSCRRTPHRRGKRVEAQLLSKGGGSLSFHKPSSLIRLYETRRLDQEKTSPGIWNPGIKSLQIIMLKVSARMECIKASGARVGSDCQEPKGFDEENTHSIQLTSIGRIGR